MKQNNKILLCLVGLLLFTSNLFGQVQITTRKEKLKDFTTKTTKIVLSGEEIFDEALRESVSNHWNISPYEFCSMDDFEKQKTNASFYFLLMVKGQFRKETDPGIDMLTLVKGDPTAKEVNDMLEVVTFPLRSTELPSGRELTILPAILDIIQTQTKSQMTTEVKAYMGLSNNNKNLMKVWTKQIHFSEEDLSNQIDAKVRATLDEDILIETEDEIEDVLTDNTYNAVVSFVVVPDEPVDGSWCYKMLIGADNHELYYFKRHKVTPHNGKGFLESDFKALTRIRK